MTNTDKRLAINMHAWIIWETETHPENDFGSLKLGNYNSFLLLRSKTLAINMNAISASLQVTIPLPAPTTS